MRVSDFDSQYMTIESLVTELGFYNGLEICRYKFLVDLQIETNRVSV